MKKIIMFVLCAAMLALPVLTCGCSEKGEVVRIYNWGDYINDEALELFEQETGIKVEYSMFSSNEEMYAKLRGGGGGYDVVFPSDYMIERMIKNDMVTELDYSKLPNVTKYTDEYFTHMAFDPENKYSTAYMWGTVGILYCPSKVSDPVNSWNILWDEKYAKQIIMYDSSRDSFMVALSRLGYDINTRDEAQLEEAAQSLKDQKELVLSYGLDNIKDQMVAGEAALSVVYSGDAVEAFSSSDDLDYVIPDEGSNVWVDCMVIPKSAKNVEAAHKFIDFMCRPDIAALNAEEIGYGSPNWGARDEMDPEMLENPIAYPSDEALARCEFYSDLGDFVETYENAWVHVKAD